MSRLCFNRVDELLHLNSQVNKKGGIIHTRSNNSLVKMRFSQCTKKHKKMKKLSIHRSNSKQNYTYRMHKKRYRMYMQFL